MPKILCFCVYDRAGTDISKTGIFEAKKTKMSTIFGNCQKPELGWETEHNGALSDRLDTILKRMTKSQSQSQVWECDMGEAWKTQIKTLFTFYPQPWPNYHFTPQPDTKLPFYPSSKNPNYLFTLYPNT